MIFDINYIYRCKKIHFIHLKHMKKTFKNVLKIFTNILKKYIIMSKNTFLNV